MDLETKRPLLRATKVFAATIALAIIALAPAFAVSVLAPYPMGDDRSETNAVETVLVIDPTTDDNTSDEIKATKDPDDNTETRYFTIVADDVVRTDIFDGSDFITITLGDENSDGRLRTIWNDSDCRIYVGPYDSQDAVRSGLYSTYEGSVKVLDEESRSVSDDCTLYWIDAEKTD